MMDGFVADLGGDHLSGPEFLAMPQDGATTLRLSGARAGTGVPVTYRSSDPARVRFIFDGRAAAEGTANLSRDVLIEGLADSGEVEITATAPGYQPKKIRVRLCPGVFAAQGGGLQLTTWSAPAGLSAFYRCLDPEANQLAPGFFALRAGVTAPEYRWTSSVPAVAEVGVISPFGFPQIVLAPRGPGEARIQLEVPGFAVWEARPFLVTVVRPRLAGVPAKISLGKDTQRQVFLAALTSGGGGLAANSFRGSFTLRSEDPSRLLLQTGSRPAAGSVTLSARPGAAQAFGVVLQALGSEGAVRVFLSGSEAEDGEIEVQLEPVALRLTPFGETARVGDTLGVSGTWVTPSGTTGLIRRAGAPPVQIQLRNSNPEVAEWNRVTFDLTSNTQVRGTAIAAGRTELTFQLVSGGFELERDRFEIEVLPAGPRRMAVEGFSGAILGKDLQMTMTVRRDQPGEVTAVSLDPSAALVSASSTAPG